MDPRCSSSTDTELNVSVAPVAPLTLAPLIKVSHVRRGALTSLKGLKNEHSLDSDGRRMRDLYDLGDGSNRGSIQPYVKPCVARPPSMSNSLTRIRSIQSQDMFSENPQSTNSLNDVHKHVLSENPQSTNSPYDVHKTTTNDVHKTEKKIEKKTEKQTVFHKFIVGITDSTAFGRIILVIILINSIVIALELELPSTNYNSQVFATLNNICLATYTVEFVLKIYAEPRLYWYSTYNLFDFAILVLAYIDLVMELADFKHETSVVGLIRSMRAFRALRSISFIKGVQVIANALVATLKQLVVDVILLLLLLMFVFGIMGYYFFGYDATTTIVIQKWGSFGDIFLTLFTLVTADQWAKFIDDLTIEGFSLYISRTYIIVFLFIGHFITSNLFIAVIITSIESSSNKFTMKKMKERNVIIQDKKRKCWYKCKNEVKWMMDKAHLDGSCNFQELAIKFYDVIQKRDFRVMSDLKTNLIWLDTLNKEIQRYQQTGRRILGVHRDAVKELGAICALTEIDQRKTSISTKPRFNVMNRLGALQLLQQVRDYSLTESLLHP